MQQSKRNTTLDSGPRVGVVPALWFLVNYLILLSLIFLICRVETKMIDLPIFQCYCKGKMS